MFNVMIIGNLGKDAEFVTSKKGKELMKFSVGVTNKTKEKTYWFDVLMNNRPALMEHLTKGVKVFIQGECEVSTDRGYLNLNVFAHDVELVGNMVPYESSEKKLAEQLAREHHLPEGAEPIAPTQPVGVGDSEDGKEEPW